MNIKNIVKHLIRPDFNRSNLMQWAASISPSKEEQKRIVADYRYLYESKGLTTDEYYEFEFETRDEGFRRTFLGLNEQRFYLDYLNPIKYYPLARNKYLAHKILENTGVRKSELFCFYQPEGRFAVNDETASNLDEVLRILKKKDVHSCVIKTTESSHGDNVWVIHAIDYQENDAVLGRFDGEKITLSSVLGRDALIFESIVHQTRQFAAFNESSVNTVRFMTTLYPDGSAKVIAVWMKFGREGKCVDNAGSGGNVDAAVDIETGRIYNVMQFDGWRKVKEVERHPDNGSQLNGVVIENWEAIKEDVKRFQQAFPYCKAAGWDIAITDDGPVVIEVNDFWDRTGQYFIRRGWRQEIRDCYLAWRKFWEAQNAPQSNVSEENAYYINKPAGREYRLYRQPNALGLAHLRKIAAHE